MTTDSSEISIAPDRVRWFYGSQNSRGFYWKPFRGDDSLRLEKLYRWSKEDHFETAPTKTTVRGSFFEANVSTMLCSPIFWSGEKRSMHSPDAKWCTTRIQRHIWFNKINWTPLEQSVDDQIEEEYIKNVLPLLSEFGLDSTKFKRNFHTFTTNEFTVTWKVNGDVYFLPKTTHPFSRIKIHGELSSHLICRGYKNPALEEDKLPDITHICFVIHGIGQQLASVRHECSKLRAMCKEIIDKRYPYLYERKQRIEFIPLDWRTTLSLNVPTIENISIGQIRQLRSYINNCFIDVLYYTSSIYRIQFIRSLREELMRQYNLFIHHNPTFTLRDGQDFGLPVKVNDLASKIERARNDLVQLELKMMRELNRHSDTYNFSHKVSRTDSNCNRRSDKFNLPQIKNLFLIGSPLALFIALNAIPARGRSFMPSSPSSNSRTRVSSSGSTSSSASRKSGSSHSQESLSEIERCAMDLDKTDMETLIPSSVCARIFNIFHSYDPVAYRLEPLLLKHYSSVAPVVVARFSDFFGKRLRKMHKNKPASPVSMTSLKEVSSGDLQSLEYGTIRGDPVASNSLSSVNNVTSISSSSSFEDTASQHTENAAKLTKRSTLFGPTVSYKPHESRTIKFFSKLVTRRSSHVTSLGPTVKSHRPDVDDNEKRLTNRIDYELQKSFSPLAIVSAHQHYWVSKSFAFFILYQTFGAPEKLT